MNRTVMGTQLNISGLISNRFSGNTNVKKPVSLPANDFDLILRQAVLRTSSAESDINISAHAEKRLQERGITLNTETRQLLGKAMSELAAKGGRDSLVLTPEAAFLVNVPTRTIITAMAPADLKDHIVTQIDSVNIKSAA